MRNFQDFIDKKIAVSFADRKELIEFLELCEKNGLKSNSGEMATKTYSLGKEQLFLSYAIPANFGLSYCSAGFAKEHYTTFTAAEFLTKSTPTIEIFQSKQTVV